MKLQHPIDRLPDPPTIAPSLAEATFVCPPPTKLAIPEEVEQYPPETVA
jgi:hypothetical protein